MKYITHCAEETIEIGKKLSLSGIVTFSGNLGAGKTTLIKGIISAHANIDPNEVTSPTFTYLNSYGHLHHFDLYRLKNEEEFLAKGFDEYLDKVCLIEWADRIKTLLVNPTHISITGVGLEPRVIEVST